MAMMKGFSNAFRVPELRKKILITLGLVVVCRLVAQIPTPGVNWTGLANIFRSMSEGSQGGFLDWLKSLQAAPLGSAQSAPFLFGHTFRPKS